MGKISSHAFFNAVVSRMEMRGSLVDTVEERAFGSIREVGEMEVSSSQWKTAASSVFHFSKVPHIYADFQDRKKLNRFDIEFKTSENSASIAEKLSRKLRNYATKEITLRKHI